MKKNWKYTEVQEREMIDLLIKQTLKKVADLNKELHFTQITHCNFRLNHPAPIEYKYWWQKRWFSWFKKKPSNDTVLKELDEQFKDK